MRLTQSVHKQITEMIKKLMFYILTKNSITKCKHQKSDDNIFEKKTKKMWTWANLQKLWRFFLIILAPIVLLLVFFLDGKEEDNESKVNTISPDMHGHSISFNKQSFTHKNNKIPFIQIETRKHFHVYFRFLSTHL